jgi:hypothetical protein
VDLVAEPDDIVIAFGVREPGGEQVAAGIELAQERGCLTLAFEESGAGGASRWRAKIPMCARRWRRPPTTCSGSWSIFFDHRGLLRAQAGAVQPSLGFLYPFLSEAEHDLDAVVETCSARR